MQGLSTVAVLMIVLFGLLIMIRQIGIAELLAAFGRLLLIAFAIFVALCLGHILFISFIFPFISEFLRTLSRLVLLIFLLLLAITAVWFVTDLGVHRFMNRDSKPSKRGEP